MRILRGFIVVILILIAMNAGGLEWPEEPEHVAGSFAGSDDGHFRRGLEFENPFARVGAWSDGEVVWTSEPGRLAGSLPSDGCVVLVHDDGFRSIYHGVEASPGLPDTVISGDVLGYSGESSWVFTLMDDRRRRAVDPLSLLPSRGELGAPQDLSVELIRNGVSTVPTSGLNLDPGNWTVVVVSGDAPGALLVEASAYWLGQNVASVRFDALFENENGVLLEAPDSRRFQQVHYDSFRLILGDMMLNTGRGDLEVRITDETGRVSVLRYPLVIGTSAR